MSRAEPMLRGWELIQALRAPDDLREVIADMAELKLIDPAGHDQMVSELYAHLAVVRGRKATEAGQ